MPNEILHKPGALTPEEWAVMAEHPVAGERILLRIPDLAGIAPVVRHEHEHWDGSGYPDGLRERLIPIGSRIILACDAYHAMITDRPYRAALTPAEASRSCGAAPARSSTRRSSTRCWTCSATSRPTCRTAPQGVRMPAGAAAAAAQRPRAGPAQVFGFLLGFGFVISVAL